MTYGELNRRSNQLGHYLRKRGVGSEVRVAICLERSLEMVVAMLGILKAGGAYVPLDAGYPQERLEYMVEDAQPKLLLTEQRLLERVFTTSSQVTCIEDAWKEIESAGDTQGESNLCIGLQPANAAYVIYTSGSTGRPKGVVVSHGNVVRLMEKTHCWFRFDEQDAWTLFHSYAFDFSVWELWGALLYGGRLVVVPYWVSRSPNDFLDLLVREQVTVLNQTPSAFQQLMRVEEERGGEERMSLRLVIFGGEALDFQALQSWLRRHPEKPQLVNMYGITETTVHVTYQPVLPADVEDKDGRSRIGVAIPDLQIYVLDDHMQPVPVGVKGELYVGGNGVARGYLNRPERTAERFVPHAFAEREGERLYRSGDQARWRPDGSLDYFGRLDQQVKVRGFRIELGEIECALLEQPGVRQALVVVRSLPGGDQRLVAYVVPAQEKTEEPSVVARDATQMREALKRRLPEYMVPSAFVLLESLPLTPNGKLDRKALPDPDFATREELEQRNPQSAEEELVSGIFAEVLKLERIGMNQSFFDVGGHSLLATQVISRLRNVFGVEMPLRALFESPTIAELAERVRQMRATGQTPASLPLPVARDGDSPLSFAQHRLWFLHQLEPQSTAYNVPMALRVTGDLDTEVFRKAVEEIVRRHEVLRTTYKLVEGEVWQHVEPEESFAVREHDLSGLPKETIDRQAERLAREEVLQAFDLEHGPLLRVSTLRLAETEHLVLVTMHHIVSDGWSMAIFVREFGALYEALRDGRPSPLPDPSMQYSDYAVWQRSWLQGEVLENELQYWRQQLAGLETLELPTDFPRPAVLTRRGKRVLFHVSPQTVRGLEILSREQGVTLFMTLLTVFQVVLGHWAGQQDVTIGTDIANRNRLETENLIGFFVNQLVLRSQWSDGLKFRELLHRVRATVLGAYEHQNVPFEKLVEALGSERELNRAPLFQVKLVLQNAPQDAQMNIKGLEFTPFNEQLGDSVKVDLHLMFVPSQTGLTGVLSYSEDLYSHATVERLVGHIKTLMEGLSAHMEDCIGELQFLTAEERAQLLLHGSCGEQTHPEIRRLHELVSEHAHSKPDATAIEWEGGRCSYQDLNARANRLARYLRALGVGPEVQVGLYGGRSLEMIVGLLGILKAGGAYVPLDGDCPKERLAWMIEDLGIGIVVTQARYRDGVPGYWIQAVCVDSDWEEIARESPDELEDQSGPDNLAYAIYTSGSTGKAKAVGIEHRQLTHYVQAMGERLGLKDCESFCLVSSLAADLGYTMVFPALASGARLHLAPEWETGKMEEYLQRASVDCLKITPTHLRAMVDRGGKPGVLPKKKLVLGGEASDFEWVQWLRTLDPKREIWNHYGPTESTVGVTAYKLESAPDAKQGRVPLGRGIPNSQTFVLDKKMTLVPVGVGGELYIGGAGLGRGYLGRPELTAEKFVPNPFSRRPGERLYKTGDRVRWSTDGNLEYLGRIDEQIKIRGYRVEPGEITDVLRGHAGVSEAIVLVRQDNAGEKRLVGYVVGRAGEEGPNPRELRNYLQERLPDYMVPARLVLLDHMPLLPNGKVDRRALPVADLMAEAERYVAPRNAVEEILATIWGEVLGVERVGAEDNFFELGGHSLLATQVIARMNDVFGVEIPLHLLFESPTVAGLAERIQEQGISIEDLLSEVESLSDEDIEVLLSAKTENNDT
ncbi:MAG TPA: amino acid adenylation domain-containing protein [Candidatus Angelobacter sp.]